jgi:hypothetical protein
MPIITELPKKPKSTCKVDKEKGVINIAQIKQGNGR